jgi:hypothetical protein
MSSRTPVWGGVGLYLKSEEFPACELGQDVDLVPPMLLSQVVETRPGLADGELLIR